MSRATISGSFAPAISLLADIREFLAAFWKQINGPYRPELHYMRGPGPACRARENGQKIL